MSANVNIKYPSTNLASNVLEKMFVSRAIDLGHKPEHKNQKAQSLSTATSQAAASSQGHGHYQCGPQAMATACGYKQCSQPQAMATAKSHKPDNFFGGSQKFLSLGFDDAGVLATQGDRTTSKLQ